MKNLIYLLVLLIFSSQIFAQVGINATGAAPASSAMLDVSSTNKGMLIPRMTTAQRTVIVSAQKGLLVFDNDTSSFWFHNGTAWQELVSNGASNWIPFNSNTELSSNNFSRFYLGSGTNTAALSSGVGNDGTLRINSPAFGIYQNYLSLDGTSIQARQSSNFAGKIEMPLKLNPFGGNVGIGISLPHAPLQFASTSGVNRKIVLFEDVNNDHQFYGFGINNGLLRYQSSGGADHVFYSATSASTSNELMRVKFDGNVKLSSGMYSNQTGNLNIVPLGVSEYTISESNNGSTVSATFSNIAGNMIFSASANTVTSYAYDHLNCTFPLNIAITSNYTKIIAMNSLSWISESGILYTYPLIANFWSSTTNTEFKVGITADGFIATGLGQLTGTVIFYGIK